MSSRRIGEDERQPVMARLAARWRRSNLLKLVALKKGNHPTDRRDGVVVRASASQLVDMGFIPLVESYQKTLKNGIHGFPAWRSAFRGDCGEQAGKFACCVLVQGT